MSIDEMMNILPEEINGYKLTQLFDKDTYRFWLSYDKMIQTKRPVDIIGIVVGQETKSKRDILYVTSSRESYVILSTTWK